jgi:hypothetical protein
MRIWRIHRRASSSIQGEEPMKIGLGVPFAAAFMLASSVGTVAAQQKKTTPATEAGINPQCAQVNNKRGCTCALETGGTLANGRWQYFNSRTYSDCMTKKGWL